MRPRKFDMALGAGGGQRAPAKGGTARWVGNCHDLMTSERASNHVLNVRWDIWGVDLPLLGTVGTVGTGAKGWRRRGYLGSERPWPTRPDTQRPLDSLSLPALLCHPIMGTQNFTVCTELFKSMGPSDGRQNWAQTWPRWPRPRLFLYLLKENFNTWGEASEMARDQHGALRSHRWVPAQVREGITMCVPESSWRSV